MAQSRSVAIPLLARVRFNSKAMAASVAGLLAGAVYLLAQSTASVVLRHEAFLAPLHRIAAMLLGPDAAIPGDGSNYTAISMGLMIHLVLSLWFGRLIASVVDRLHGATAVAAAALIGCAIYIVNYQIIAPSAFPWFYGGAITLVDHALFGVLVGVLYARLNGASD